MERYVTRARKEGETAGNSICEVKIQWESVNMKV